MGRWRYRSGSCHTSPS
ncbi:hypothetical protein CGLO_18074 [Colletotrichum gloeosporioides Cg-14]|uniref:Uncharacterized protein n=1 Tax=Colletotrichum gloeosporioides (strain Cg-14) TaxID=1237896 RepID=T0L4W9_COLGC|nr:hypothetical protein CGLO_18074 [Colletotrichum gloeosporioides Cg-14]